MKIIINTFCNYCFEEANKSGQDYDYNQDKHLFVELNEEGFYSFECPKKHTQWKFIHAHLFQILFDLGTLALSDSYTREAISSYAASLERFYEFIIKLIYIADEIEENKLDAILKNISNQSERQLGAFITLYSYKFNNVPKILNNNWRKFRNEVTHKGKIPKEKDSIKFGQIISDQIFDILFELKKYYGENIIGLIHKVYIYNINKIKEKYPQIDKESGGSYPNLIQLRTIQSEEFKRLDINSEVLKYRNSEKFIKLSYAK